jgi:hypothetical protein
LTLQDNAGNQAEPFPGIFLQQPLDSHFSRGTVSVLRDPFESGVCSGRHGYEPGLCSQQFTASAAIFGALVSYKYNRTKDPMYAVLPHQLGPLEVFLLHGQFQKEQ